MKRFFFWLFVIALAALNWAALHDIIKDEPDVWMEWTVLVASIILLIAYLIRRSRDTNMH